MTRLIAALFCAVALSSAAASAQTTPSPSPTPNAESLRTYEDLGLTVQVTDACISAGQRPFQIEQLESSQSLQPFAQWICNRHAPIQVIVAEEPFSGGTNSAGFEVTFENELRGAIDGALIKKRGTVSLSNGYPAIFDEVTSGEGFNVTKVYAWVWADGLRGVAVEVVGRLGDLDEQKAKAVFKEMKAVVFPQNRIERQPPR